MWVLVYAIGAREQGEDTIQVDNWSEKDPDAWVVDQEHQGVRYAVVSVAIKRRVDDALDELLEAANLGSGPRCLAAHQDQQVNGIESQLEFFLVADQA